MFIFGKPICACLMAESVTVSHTSVGGGIAVVFLILSQTTRELARCTKPWVPLLFLCFCLFSRRCCFLLAEFSSITEAQMYRNRYIYLHEPKIHTRISNTHRSVAERVRSPKLTTQTCEMLQRKQ